MGDEGPAYRSRSFVCEACAVEDAARARDEEAVREHGGHDLLHGRYWIAVPDRSEEVSE